MKRWLLPVTAALLAACGQGGGGSGGPKTYAKLGTVSYLSVLSDGKTTNGVTAAFNSVTPPVAAPPALDPALLDTCQLGQGEAYTNVLGNVFAGSGDLDAGLALTLSKGGVAFATVALANDNNSIGYTSLVNLTGLSGVTVSAPGGGFPAFSNVPLPLPTSAFALTSPADPKAVTPATPFVWSGASNVPGAVVLLLVKLGNAPVFACAARDDGNFSIPADFQTLLAQQPFTKGVLTTAFQLVPGTTVEVGDALLQTKRVALLNLQ